MNSLSFVCKVSFVQRLKIHKYKHKTVPIFSFSLSIFLSYFLPLSFFASNCVNIYICHTRRAHMWMWRIFIFFFSLELSKVSLHAHSLRVCCTFKSVWVYHNTICGKNSNKIWVVVCCINIWLCSLVNMISKSIAKWWNQMNFHFNFFFSANLCTFAFSTSIGWMGIQLLVSPISRPIRLSTHFQLKCFSIVAVSVFK